MKELFNPLVYIITINWNGIDDTIECLDSLKGITYPNCKIIVVDNGSKNNQAEKIKEKFRNIELIKNKKNEGFVIANNQGIKLALKNDADYILLLNNDTIIKNDFLNILIEYAEKDNNVGILSPKIIYYDSEMIWSMGGRISYLTGISIMIGKTKKPEQYNKIIEPDFLTGCAMLIKRKVFDKIGLLDPIYFAYYEDVDFSFKARKAGYTIKVIPESIIWHKKSASAGIRGSIREINKLQAYLWARNGIIFGRKNISGWRKISFLFGHLTFKFLFVLLNLSKKKYIRCYVQGLIHARK
jgi:hypothetical protein